MKILFDSASTVMQNAAGGVGVRMRKTLKRLADIAEVKFFDKWEDKIADFDILHIFKVSTEVISEIKHAKKHGVKVVVSSVIDPNNNFKLTFNKLVAMLLRQQNSFGVIKKSLQLADAIMCQTEKERRFVIKMYKTEPHKVFVVPSAMDDVRADASPEYFRKSTGIEGKFIIQVGRFDRNKNQLSVIRAVKGTDMQLVLVGGPDKSDASYFEQCKAEAGENVHFLGWIDHNDPLLCSAYAAAHSFIIPSYHEIFGNTLFESGMYGCNLVSTNALPIDDWGITDYCLTVNPNSIDDIRNKLRASLEKARTGEIAEIIKWDYSWESVLNKYMTVYKYVLDDEGVK